jgi:uncharacterized RDD family membrane protein YckC
MTNPPAGWFPDPAPQTYLGRQRYWDGTQWTEHLHDPWPPVVPQYYQPTTPKPAPLTPDGQPLASWGERVGAQLIDSAVSGFLSLAIWVPVVATHWDQMRDWFTAVDQLDPETDDSLPRLPDFINPTTGLFWELVGISLLIGAVYVLGFWRWKQATPGKLAMGLRIRRRESPDFPWSAMGLRYGITLIFGFIGVLSLLDVLWPLWDDKRQALHDKVAGTNVVSVRREHSAEAVPS